MAITCTEWTVAEDLFSANVYKTTLNGGINGSVLSAVVNDTPPGTPTTPFWATIDRGGSASMEIVQVTAVGGTGNKTWTIVRAQSGTSAQSHLNAASIMTTLSVGAGFMGGDGNVSVDLGSSRVLWMFDDPIWATAAGQQRSDFPNGHHILAIQAGYDLSTATLTWYPKHGPNGNVISYFPDYADTSPNFRWVGAAVMLDGKLIIIGPRIAYVGNPSGGAPGNGGWAIMVDNPTATPDNWNWFPVPGPLWSTQMSASGDPTYGYASIQDPGDGFVYVWASNSHRFYVSRFLRADAKGGRFGNPQWWCGPLGWSFEDRARAVVKRPVLSGSTFLAQGTQHKRPDGQWQFTGTDDGSTLQYSLRANPTGAFPALSSLYTIPNYGPAINYAAGSHPELTFSGQASNDVVMVHTPGLTQGSTHPEAYLPKFVKVVGI